jgi:hypothetical protein
MQREEPTSLKKRARGQQTQNGYKKTVLHDVRINGDTDFLNPIERGALWQTQPQLSPLPRF